MVKAKTKEHSVHFMKDPKERLVYWIKERYSIYLKKEAGKPKPWTTDQILRSYRFCNVHRENDRVTKWIAETWRDPPRWRNHSDLWFAMAVARFVNWPDTLMSLGFPIPWNPDECIAILNRRKEHMEKVWTGAYMIGTNGVVQDKPSYIFKTVLDPLWQQREQLRPKKGMTLQAYSKLLVNQHGLSGFLTGQIIADIKYVEPLRNAKDWETWAISGPGSRRGLNRVLQRGGTSGKVAWKEEEWLKEVTKLRKELAPQLKGIPLIHAQDFQNCLCEFDKYDRVLFNEGKPRSLYDGGGIKL